MNMRKRARNQAFESDDFASAAPHHEADDFASAPHLEVDDFASSPHQEVDAEVTPSKDSLPNDSSDDLLCPSQTFQASEQTSGQEVRDRRNSRFHFRAAKAKVVPASTPEIAPNCSEAEKQDDSLKQKRKRVKEPGVVEDQKVRIKRRVKNLVNRIRQEQNLIDAYSGDGWKGNSREKKIRPEKELQRARVQILQCKLAIRDLIHDLDVLSKEGCLEETAFDEEGEVFAEDIFCAKCKSHEPFVGNDIILCDGACDRAFHQECLEPPLATADIPPGDEGWLCPVCDSKVECLNYMNDYLGTEFQVEDQWEKVFAAAATMSAGAANDLGDDWAADDDDDDDESDEVVIPDSKEEEDAQDIELGGTLDALQQDWPSDDEDDDEYDPDRPDSEEEEHAQDIEVGTEALQQDWPSDDEDDEEYDPDRSYSDEEDHAQGLEYDSEENAQDLEFGGTANAFAVDWPSDDEDDNEYDPDGSDGEEEENAQDFERGGAASALAVDWPSDDEDDGEYVPGRSEGEEEEHGQDFEHGGAANALAAEWPSEDDDDDEYTPDRVDGEEEERAEDFEEPIAKASLDSPNGSEGRDTSPGSSQLYSDDYCQSSGLSGHELKLECSTIQKRGKRIMGVGNVGQDLEIPKATPLSGKRERKPVDYKKLHEEMFGNEEHTDDGMLSEDGDWGPGMSLGREGKPQGSNGGSRTRRSSTGSQKKQRVSLSGQKHDDKNKPRKSSSGQRFEHRDARRLPDSAVATLRKEFELGNCLPSRTCKESLAKELGITVQRVNSWFKNARRAKNVVGPSTQARAPGKTGQAYVTADRNSGSSHGHDIEFTNGLLVEKSDDVQHKLHYLKQTLEALLAQGGAESESYSIPADGVITSS